LNSFVKVYTQAAQVGYPAQQLIANLDTQIEQGTVANLNVSDGEDGLEKVGTTAAINDMLVQSSEGMIDLFPDWPANEDASFYHLLTQGAFEVSSSLKDGQVQYATVTSEAGLPLELKDPWPGQRLSVTGQRGIPVRYTVRDGMIALPTQKGQTYQISVNQSVYQTPYPSLGAAYDNVGVTADNDTNAGDIDGFGSSFSASALAELGVSPGSPIHFGGLTFTWPDSPAGQPDNVLANGQIIDLSGSGSTLGLLLTSIYPTLSTGTVVYTDGSSQQFTINLPNWGSPRAGDAVVFTPAYRNRPGNTQDTGQVSVFYVGVPLAAGKTVKQLILPAVGDTVGVNVPSLHVWSAAIG
jgi:hypothetical protein